MRPRSIRSLFLLLAGCLAAGSAAAQEAPRVQWTARTLDLFASLPVQDGGRVKPLDTFAQFRLLRMNGKRSLRTPEGEKLSSTPWLLDCLFFPELARTYRAFLVRNQGALDVIGVRVEGRKKSDRYSYDELVPGRSELASEYERIRAIEEKDRNGLDTQLFALALNVRDFESLIHALEFTRVELPTAASPMLQARFGSEPARGVTGFLGRIPDMRANLAGEMEKLSEEERETEHVAFERVSNELARVVAASSSFAIFPPAALDEEEWYFTDGAADRASRGESPEELAFLAGWEELERAKGAPEAFEAALGKLHAGVTALAERRGEYAKVPLEVSFYRGDYFTRALVSFLAAFVLLSASWLAPRSRWPGKGVWVVSLVGTLLVVVGVVLRCIIRERPPISTLYETILFVTGTGAIVLFLVERFTRRGIALSLIPLWGAVGLFLSMKYELKEAATAGDTMPSLVAVLDTNFWLATHVTTITLGYSAGLVAAVLGMRWMLGRIFGHRRDDKDHYRALTRMTYGVVCFGLIFSVIGTILGGIWANYSWGRFWGWDPKENGALLICLAELMILHLRMGGYIKDFGLAVLACMNGMVVAFSWFGVNLLNVGLHSYGFTSGIAMALYSYYGLSLAVVIAALIWRAVRSEDERSKVEPTKVDTARA